VKPDISLIFANSPFLIDASVFPPLGILYLSAYLRRLGLEVQCLDMALGHTPEMADADIVGVSFTTPQRKEAFEIAKKYVSEGRHAIIAGGPHATHLPDECLDEGFTHAIGGYGEILLADLMEYLTGKRFGPIFDMEDPNRKHVDDYPFPDRGALPIGRYHYTIDGEPATPVMTTRGCAYHCSICGKIDDNFRMQSAERTVAEFRYIRGLYGYNALMIFDDVFVASKKRLQKIADMIGDSFKLRCFARSNLLDDEACRLLKCLGVVEVGIGIESGSTEILKRNMKGTTRGMNTNAVKRLHDHGIRAKAFLIVGLPGETTETVMETADWVFEAEPDDVDVSVFQPMPGSRIFAEPEKWGIQFEYNGKPGWYKGTPGEYEPLARTEGLTGMEILTYRDMLEDEFKRPELLK